MKNLNSYLNNECATLTIDEAFAKKGKKLWAKYPDKRKKLMRALDRIAADPMDAALRTKKYKGADGMWQSYVENNTPSAWRVHWMWAADGGVRVVEFGPHT
jgi:hypothetical protein